MPDQTTTPLERLREKFPKEVEGILPKPYKADSAKGNCNVCGGYHGLPAAHLPFVGHAAVVDRLLATDPEWNWEPMGLDEHGLPALDRDGNLWIRLTVCGVTRLGVGDGPSMKVRIGDCLVRDTPVTTARGVVPIQEVRVGDMVPTRQGWRPITDAWMSHSAAPVMTVTFADGRMITGTPHHTVPTENGVKRIDALRKDDILYVWPDTANSLVPKRSSGKVGRSDDSLSTPSGVAGSTSWKPPLRASTSTGPSMRSTSDPSRLGGTSTTATMTRSTTTRATLRRSHRLNTQATTAPATPSWPASALAAVTSSLAVAVGRSGAAPHVSNSSVETQGWSSRALARVRSLSRGRVSSAVTSTKRSRLGSGSARLRVSSVGCAGTGEVWNLSVGEVHEYVANGVFVHNSIRNAAMRFGVALYLWTKDELESDVALESDEKPSRSRAPKSQPAPESAKSQPASDKGEKDPAADLARRKMWAVAREKFPDEAEFRAWIADGLGLDPGMSLSLLTAAQMDEARGHLRNLATPDGPNIGNGVS